MNDSMNWPQSVRRVLLIGRISLVCLVWCLAWRTSFAAQPEPIQRSESGILDALPPEVRSALIVGEPEFGLRLLTQESSGDVSALSDPDRRAIRAVYKHAVRLRFDEQAEGALADLVLNGPAWLGDERADASQKLARLWMDDPNPDRRSLTRRLRWYENIQNTIRPAPLNIETPITLVLLTLDHVDRVTNPAEVVALLEIAERISPGNPIWSSYQPDDLQLLRAAEQLAREERYIAAGEIYRRLINTTEGDAEWFKRHYASNQLNRVYALAGTVGADFAIQAAARLRQEFLEPEELGRFRLLKENLRNIVAEHDAKRRLPAVIDGDLKLEALPVGYLIEDKVILQKGGHLTFEAGSIVRGGGRIVLQGGQVTFQGTAEEPVILVGLVFESEDVAGGGIIDGSNVQFRNCTFRRATEPTLPGAMRWRITYAYAANCAFPFDPHVDAEWSQSEFDGCGVTLPLLPVGSLRPNTDEPALEMPREPGPYVRFDTCVFRDCGIDDFVPIRATKSEFIDCEITRWNDAPHRTVEASDPTFVDDRLVVHNVFIPRGGIPAAILRRARFAEGNAPYIFSRNEVTPVLRLGHVRQWIE